MKRRDLLKAGVALPAAVGASARVSAAEAALIATVPVEASSSWDGERIWLGAPYWANRLQDWKRSGRWLECLRGEESFEARTVGILTHSLLSTGSARLEADIEAIAEHGRGGFGGFLLGVGGGKLDHRAAALAQRGSGKGGGIFAVVDCDGRPSLREHTSDTQPLAFAELDGETAITRRLDLAVSPVRLACHIDDQGAGRAAITLIVLDAGGQESARTRVEGVPSEYLTGALALMSSPPSGQSGARFRLAELHLGGDRISHNPERALGPCLAAMHSLTGGVLKLSAHFFPIGGQDASEATLQLRVGSGWRSVDSAAIGDGYCAQFRVEGLDDTIAYPYRVRHVWSGRERTVYEGTIRPDPVHANRELVIALHGCVLSTQHALEDNVIRQVVPQERTFGRYEPENFNFPHSEIVGHTIAHDPDIVVVSGDQYYEQNPTRVARHTPDAKLDTLYRWHQWLVSFRDLIRDRPAILLVDDHDVLQGNLWGQGGRHAPDGEQNNGGYVWGDAVNLMVYRMQTEHNPDPADPTPIENGMPVSYGAFLYGGTSFAIVEDRKWKTSAIQGEDMDVHRAHLLGERQEQFLAAWKGMHPGAPKVLLTQSLWGCLQTDPTGQPLLDFDSNGYPPLARRRATELAADAGCIILSGDQHLPSLVRLGVERFDDGPIQFTGPAGGSFWQRWFEPAEPLPNARPELPAITGDFRDAFANPMRVLAVANPKISFRDFRKHNTGRSQAINDRSLKSEGYGIVRIDTSRRRATFECWPWDQDPSREEASQFAGWPYIADI